MSPLLKYSSLTFTVCIASFLSLSELASKLLDYGNLIKNRTT